MAQGRNIVIVGATSTIAEHCARLWLKQEVAQLVLVARDGGRAEQLAADLRVRSPGTAVRVLSGDFSDPADVARLVADAVAQGSPDIVLIAHGHLPDQQVCESDLAAAHDALHINAVSPALFAQAFAAHMARAGAGRLGIIGSVAGDRGRKSNYVYGAAKGLVERFAQGLQHRLAGTGVKVSLIKPGPTDTRMTRHLKEQGASLASVEAVARAIVGGMERGRPVIYAPAPWALKMMIVRHLPRFVFNRLDI